MGRALLVAVVLALVWAAPARALMLVRTSNGAVWQLHDAAPPGLDTGSVRAITDHGFSGFGGIRVRVSAPARMNGELLRGFGLRDGTTTTPVGLGGVAVSRAVKVSRAGNWARWVDTFANTTARTLTVEVSFGGSAGQNTGHNRSVLARESGWAAVSFPSPRGASARGPFAVVPAGAVSDAAPEYAFRDSLTLAPGQTRSLLRYVVAGRAETGRTAGLELASVNAAAATLAAAPDLSGLSRRMLCTVANWRLAVGCARVRPPPLPVLAAAPATTSARYDVVDKTITQLQADLVARRTTARELTRAYLDRIAAYDRGPFGFHAFITVAPDALFQAAAADARRAAGENGPLLGIPVIVKDVYDTKDMPTTGGSRALAGWRPRRDAEQVARLRAAGAVILGKGNLSELALASGASESGFGTVWNAFKPSKTPLGSSGGTAVAVALSLAGFGLGTQTGVSLAAPASAASLVTLRGTDGLASSAGVMPLSWLQDYGGALARSTGDLARILEVTTDRHDWRAALRPGALRGARLGYVRAAFLGAGLYGQDDGTGAAAFARVRQLAAAGATVVEMSSSAPGPPPRAALAGDRTEEGWQRYFARHARPPYRTAGALLSSPRLLAFNRGRVAPRPRLTAADVRALRRERDQYKARLKAWMDANGVDAVVYPGLRSDVYDNDGAPALSADRETGIPTSAAGVPALVLPAGANPHGDPLALQFLGRAGDDAKLLGYGYALEQRLGGHLAPTTAPKLPFKPAETRPGA